MEQFIPINLETLDNKDFYTFSATSPFRVLMKLIRHINRSSDKIVNINKNTINIFKEFSEKGLLVSRYSQDNLAMYFNTKQPNISRDIKKLKEEGLIKVIKVKSKKIVNNYIKYENFYQLGTFTIDNDGKRLEELFLNQHFANNKIKAKEEAEKKAKEEYYKNEFFLL